jgi:hypothetical protein
VRLSMINRDRRLRLSGRVAVGRASRSAAGGTAGPGRRGLGWLEEHGGTRVLRARYYDAGVSSASPDTSMTLSRCPGVALWTTTHQPGRRPASRPSCAAVSEKGRQR